MMKRGRGVKYEPQKLTDYCGAFRCSSVEFPSEYILEKQYIPDVRDQKSVNSCVGYAITNIMQILNWKETGKRDRFSPGYVYGRLRDDNDLYEGMFVRETLDKLIKYGAPYEVEFPYNVEMPKIREMVLACPELDEKAEPYKIKGYEIYQKADMKAKINDIKTAIYTLHQPILCSTDFFWGGNHAVCIIGWNDKKGWKILNSWGTSYGINGDGIGHISYDSVARGYLLVDEKNSNMLMPFTDVGDDNKNKRWYYDAVKEVYNAGYMNGTSETTFSPDAYLTRAQAAQLIMNVVKRLDDARAEDRAHMARKTLWSKIKDVFKNIA